LQSVQAYVGAPITATFLVGILWRGATARAAFTTLVFGGLVGAARFLLDILRNGFGYDLGPLNAVVAFSFLNFSVIVFFVCVGLMIALSRAGEAAEPGRIAGVKTADVLFTVAVGGAILALWHNFA
jgi:SSS family solute:Na+ symporter